jgi:hypothetical protein
MSDKLSEQELDLLVYVLDVWVQSNDQHPAVQKVEDLSDKLSRCSGARLKD